jgi:outer membrane murein-binding lipoprotein Lpp
MLRLAFLVLFAVSVVLNVVALAGCFHRDLVREKDELIDRFQRRVEDLEKANEGLSVRLSAMEKSIAEYAAVDAKAGRKLEKIMEKYYALRPQGTLQ